MSYDNLQCFCMQHMSTKNSTTCQADGKDDILFFLPHNYEQCYASKGTHCFSQASAVMETIWSWRQRWHKTLEGLEALIMCIWMMLEPRDIDSSRRPRSALGTSLWLPALSRDPGLSGGIDHTNDIRSCTAWSSRPRKLQPTSGCWLQTISSSYSQLGRVERKQQKSAPRTKPLQWMAHDTSVCKEGCFMVRLAPHSPRYKHGDFWPSATRENISREHTLSAALLCVRL